MEINLVWFIILLFCTFTLGGFLGFRLAKRWFKWAILYTIEHTKKTLSKDEAEIVEVILIEFAILLGLDK